MCGFAREPGHGKQRAKSKFSSN